MPARHSLRYPCLLVLLVGCSGASAASIGGGGLDAGERTDDDAGGGALPEAPFANEDGGAAMEASTDDGAAWKDGGGGSDGSDGAPPPDCGPPPALHPSPDAGVYCPFQGPGAAFRCAAGTHCCVYPTSFKKDATCNVLGVACDPGEGVVDFGCDEPSDCPGASPVCCMKGSVEDDPMCHAFGKSVTATVCRPAVCGASEVQVCSGSGQCPVGKTCVPFATRGKELGACR